MERIKISLDQTPYVSKPTGAEISIISNRIGASGQFITANSFRSFAECVGEKGQSFCPSTFHNGKRNTENFDQMQLSVLDFDGGVSFDIISNRAQQYDLPILFAYDTFSSENHNRFRVVFLNDVPIKDRRAAEILQNSLVTVFPEADKGSKEVTRMYFGGKELLYFDESIPEINIESAIRSMTAYQKKKYGMTHYKRKIDEFAKANNIKLNRNKLLDIFVAENVTEHAGTEQNGKNLPSPIILNKALGKNLPNLYYVINLDEGCTSSCSVREAPNNNRNIYRSSILKSISCKCKLIKNLEEGHQEFPHKELVGIATNLMQIESGDKYFLKIINEYSRCEKDKPWDYYLSYFKQNGYKPSSCSSFCPYQLECNHKKNIISTVAPRRNSYEKIEGYEEQYFPIEEVQRDVKEKIYEAIEAYDNKVHIIKAQTAIGKTRTFLKAINHYPSKKFLIAVPTNFLKSELFHAALDAEIEVIKTPSLDEIKNELPDDIWDQIQEYYRSGRNELVNPYAMKVGEDQNIACLKEHYKALKKFHDSECNVITTHKRLLSFDEETLNKFDVIIIDEDIILKGFLPNQVEMEISELKEVAKETTNSVLKNKIHQVLKAVKTKTMFTLPPVFWDNKEDGDGISTGIDIPSFCSATKFYYRKAAKEKNLSEDTLVFIKPVKLKKNVKYIMVSATVDEEICDYYFGADRVEFSECKTAAYTGTLVQYPELSMSRTCIDNHEGIIEKIKRWSGFENTITFMKYSLGPLHFGNTEGSNSMAGENIDVIGTPYEAEFLYKLAAYTLGLNFDMNAEMKPQIVNHNGFTFRFTTYEDEALRDMQFWMIESELEQAVGRARLLRYDCKVNLFSNFPLRQAELRESEY